MWENRWSQRPGARPSRPQRIGSAAVPAAFRGAGVSSALGGRDGRAPAASSRVILIAALLWLCGPVPRTWSDATPEPVVYTLRFPAPETHTAVVEATIPTGKRGALDLMMPVWSPGFYRVEDYAGQVQELSARAPEGTALAVTRPQKNRWQVQTGGAPAVIVTYRLLCRGRSVTTNWVGPEYAVLNGPSTFVTPAESTRRPHEVRLELPAAWKQSATGLEAAPGGRPHHYRAAYYDTLADSPIVAGNLTIQEFTVAGSKHEVVAFGDTVRWDLQRVARDLETIVRQNHRFWGFLPFRRYVFLLVFRQGGGGLEHANSTLVTCSPRAAAPGVDWHMFACHEYFHAFNVKRLRPVELGPFDYERPPKTASLWVSEGLTVYYDEVLVARAGLAGPADVLGKLSGQIRQLQTSPGRLVQTLEQSSLNVWTSGFSGFGQNRDTSVSYYVKGPVVGFLLDARIRRATDGRKSLDDVMRLAYQRYAGERGFTPEQFRAAADEAAGVDLGEWLRKALASTEELDYAEALDWFGLRFAAPAADRPGQPTWKLEIREDATDAQKAHLRAWLGG